MPFQALSKLLGVELDEVSLTEKMVAALGGGLAIFSLVIFSFWALPKSGATAIVASMGASAVLLFAVPHGQLSQPWPVLTGHFVSAVIGISCARYVPDIAFAAALAVGASIAAMHFLKCIHPPGGATALTAVLGGSAIHELGYSFVVFPVLSNSVVMVLLAIAINGAFKWRRYPTVFNQLARKPVFTGPNEARPLPSHDDVVAALRSLDSFVDISEEDLLRLTEILSRRATTSLSS